MVNFSYDFKLDDDITLESLNILINQCWKILPIYEGKNINNNNAYSREDAYDNYQKHLTFLITKVGGASKLWLDNQYYVELLYILSGMRDFTSDEHDRVKYIVNHCIKLINSMKKKVQDNES